MKRITRQLALFLVVTLGVVVAANAEIVYTTDFNAFYGTSGGYDYRPVLGSCLTCHPSGSTRNTYANDWRNNRYNFASVEAFDSDQDGFTNIAEINAGTFPGDPISRPVITNNPPIANAGPDQTVNEGVTVTLNGFNSSDPGGVINSYLWTQTGGTSVVLSGSTSAQPTFTAPIVGLTGASLTFQLTVTDNGGLQSTDTCDVKVMWVNQPPTASAGLDQTVNEGITVTLNGSGSTDPDDGIASYNWAQTGGPSVVLSSPSVVSPTFVSPPVATGGTSLMFVLTVTDGAGQSATDTCYVNVSRDNLPPVADAGLDQTVNEGATVTLNGSGSNDPDGNVASYHWAQTGGLPVTLSSTSVARPTFFAPNVGPDGNALTFELTVTDDGGLNATTSTTVNITWLNGPPLANAGASQTVAEGATVTLDGSSSIDPDDGIAGYLWSQNGGPAVMLSDAGSIRPTFVTPVVDIGGATLLFTLTVTDSGGLKASGQVSIEVNDNGIEGFPADVLTALTFAGEPFGVKENNGGSFTRLEPLDPDTMPQIAGEPQNMLFGLIDMEIKVASPGDTTTVTLYLPAPVPPEHEWYKYTATRGWINFSGYAVFNQTRDQVTLTLTDGGPGDDDGVVNGVIVDPSGPGVAAVSSVSPTTPSTTSADWGGGGGCFISAAGCETVVALPAKRWSLFRDLLLRFGLVD